MTDISREAVERQVAFLERNLADFGEVSDLLRALRDALDRAIDPDGLEHRANEEARHGHREALSEAHRAGWGAAIEAARIVAAEWEETFDKRGDDNASYGAALCFRDILALPYKPQEDVSDG